MGPPFQVTAAQREIGPYLALVAYSTAVLYSHVLLPKDVPTRVKIKRFQRISNYVRYPFKTTASEMEER